MGPDGEKNRTNKEAYYVYWLQLMKRTSQVSNKISQSIQRTLNNRENLDSPSNDGASGTEGNGRGPGRGNLDNGSMLYPSIE